VAAVAAVVVLTAGVSVAGVPVPRLASGAWRSIVHFFQGGVVEETATSTDGRGNGQDGSPAEAESDGLGTRPPSRTDPADAGQPGGDSLTSPNQNPTAVDDETETREDLPVTIDVLANDFDPDDDPLKVAASSSLDGSVAVEREGLVTYTPAPDFSGIARVGYTVLDESGGADQAAVTVIVRPVNDQPLAKDDEATTEEDTAVTIEVLDNDVDVDDDELSVDAKQPETGSVSTKQDGTVRYAPASDFAGTETFTYEVTDGTAKPIEATVKVTVNPVNDPPTARDDEESTGGLPVTIDLLANDTDPDGDALSVQLGPEPENVNVTINPDGTVTYTPDAGLVGRTVFSYRAFDGAAMSDVATVTVIVRPPDSPPNSVERLP
jgi:hypothetical protein